MMKFMMNLSRISLQMMMMKSFMNPSNTNYKYFVIIHHTVILYKGSELIKNVQFNLNYYRNFGIKIDQNQFNDFDID